MSDSDDKEVNNGCKYKFTSDLGFYDSLLGGRSAYNDGKGISVTTQFSALPCLNAGAKRRKNAAPPKAVSKIFFIHEDMTFKDVLTKLVLTLKREDLFDGFSLDDGTIAQAPFDLLYSIARTSSKNIDLQTVEDFATMMAEITTKSRPSLVISMTEKKASPFTFYLSTHLHALSIGECRREQSGK